MTLYKITTSVTVEADNLDQAAKKALILNELGKPDEYFIDEVGDEDDTYPGSIYRVDLTEEQKAEARALHKKGGLFERDDLTA